MSNQDVQYLTVTKQFNVVTIVPDPADDDRAHEVAKAILRKEGAKAFERQVQNDIELGRCLISIGYDGEYVDVPPPESLRLVANGR
jgi:hypothetical protein